MATAAPSLPSDRQLLDAVRRGSDAAWSELLARHLQPLRALLRGRRERRAFERSLDGLRDRLLEERECAEGDPAIRSFRPRVLAIVFGGDYGPSGSLRIDGAELLATAFARLPEPWQTVLWLRAVEGLDDDEIAPLVGRAPGQVADLVATARRGLADAFLIESEGTVPAGADVGPLAEVIDHHLASVIVPGLAGAASREPVCARRPRRRRLSARML